MVVRARSFHVLLVLLFTFIPTSTWAQFTISSSSSSVTIHPGDQNIPVPVQMSAGSYQNPVTVTMSGLPSGVTATSVQLTSGGAGTIYLNASIAAGQELFPNSKPSTITTHAVAASLVAADGSNQVSSPFNLTISISNPAFSPGSSAINLPIININTNGTPVVSKVTLTSGTITITSADQQTSYLPSSSNPDNTATFHLHGNTTVLMPKQAYEFKLSTSTDLLSAMGYTCPYVTSKGKEICDKSKTYILLANYDDKTLLRDWSASALANAIPYGGQYLSPVATSPATVPSPSGNSTVVPWAPHSVFAEMFLNGVYEGTYQLIEKVNVDSHRININEESQTDTAQPALSGGYLLEIDQRGDEDYDFTTPHGLVVGLLDPDYTPEVQQQTAYITNYVDAAETALFSSNFTDPSQGWRAYFDEASAINFYIVNEIMGNQDGGNFFSSVYLYKDLNNNYLYMGPVWDFDISSGNDNYGKIENPTVAYMANSVWYARWLQDPGFKADLVKQWNTLKSNGVFTSWLNSVNSQSQALSQAEQNNFSRWPMLGLEVWPNPEATGNYQGEVGYMTNYINLRMAYLDSVLNGKAQTATTLSIASGPYSSGSPVTFTANASGSSSLGGSISFLANNSILGTASIDGSGNATFTAASLPAGNDSIIAVYSGDDANALSSSTLMTINVTPALIATTTVASTPSSTISAGDSIVLTASILGGSSAVPATGTVTFSINGTAFGAASLSGNGTAVLSTTTLPGGSDTLQATYSGDATYATSVSPASTLTVSTAAIPGPAFSLPAGVYTGTQSVALSASTAGATIYYTTDGTTPGPSSKIYSSPISVGPSSTNIYGATETIQAIAAVPNSGTSGVASSAYGIQTQTPSFSVAAGSYSTPQQVALSAGSGVTIHYTTDGSAPTYQSPTYTGPITIASGTETITAFAHQSGLLQSPNVASTYQVTPVLPAPVFSLAGGTYTGVQTLSISSTQTGSTIYYTTDGSSPTTSSPVYSGPISLVGTSNIYGGTETVQAIAAKTGFTPSSISSASYIIQTAAPAFNIAGGNYTTAQTVTITASGTASIHYTTDGSAPTFNSPTYTAPITINSGTETITAFAHLSGFTQSQNVSATYTVTPVLPAPAFSLAGGTYTGPQTLKLSGAQTGSSIYYTLDGSTPTTSSTLYTKPIALAGISNIYGGPETVQAVSAQTGYTTSAITSAMFTIQTAAPTLSLAAGTYATSQTVTITTTPAGATVHYTTDGSTPTYTSPTYTGPLTITAGTETISAFAHVPNQLASPVTMATYTVQVPTPPPAFSLAAGSYTGSQTLTISDPGASIYYTIDGSTPTTSSTLYHGSIHIGASSNIYGSVETVQAIGVENGAASTVSSAGYAIVTGPLTFSVPAGTYATPQTVTLTSTSPGSTIHYTLDGSTPTYASPTYTGPISVTSGSVTISAFAHISGYAASPVATSTYTIQPSQ